MPLRFICSFVRARRRQHLWQPWRLVGEKIYTYALQVSFFTSSFFSSLQSAPARPRHSNVTFDMFAHLLVSHRTNKTKIEPVEGWRARTSPQLCNFYGEFSGADYNYWKLGEAARFVYLSLTASIVECSHAYGADNFTGPNTNKLNPANITHFGIQCERNLPSRTSSHKQAWTPSTLMCYERLEGVIICA